MVAVPFGGRGRWRRRRQVSPSWLIEPPACSRIDPHSRLLQFLRTDVLFFVLLVGFEILIQFYNPMF